jgi:hypothetical protein
MEHNEQSGDAQILHGCGATEVFHDYATLFINCRVSTASAWEHCLSDWTTIWPMDKNSCTSAVLHNSAFHASVISLHLKRAYGAGSYDLAFPT